MILDHGANKKAYDDDWSSDGILVGLDATTDSFLSAWTVGGDLGGIDITPDGSTLIVADRTFDLGTAKGNVVKIEISTGSITTKQFDLSESDVGFHETGSWDVVAMSNDRAFFTSDFVGSSWNPFREWNSPGLPNALDQSDGAADPDLVQCFQWEQPYPDDAVHRRTLVGLAFHLRLPSMQTVHVQDRGILFYFRPCSAP